MNFTSDWFSNNIPNWKLWLAPFVGEPIDAIEIGSYEGRSACWLVEHVLTNRLSHLTCVDVQILPALRTNLHKVAEIGWSVFEGPSSAYWKGGTDEQVDIIYLDGDHSAKGVLQDSVHAWETLKPGGILIWDDYLWGLADDPTVAEWDRPGPVIDAFLSAYRNELERLPESPDAPTNPGWQVAVRKR